MTCTYDTSVCVACCHLAFSVEVSLTWCVLISRLFLSVVLCPSHLLNSFLSPGEQEICFHIILILIKVHIFSLSQSLIKWHLQQQVLGHGLSGSPEMCSCKQLFPWKECQVQHFRVLGKFSWSAWKKNVLLSILLVPPGSFSVSVLVSTLSCLSWFTLCLSSTEVPNSKQVSGPPVQPLQPAACLLAPGRAETTDCAFLPGTQTVAENSVP